MPMCIFSSLLFIIIFCMVVAGRIALNIQTFVLGDHFLSSHQLQSSDILGRDACHH